MVIIAEQERLIASEATLINNTTSYSFPKTTVGTVHDYGNITLAQPGIVIFQFTLAISPQAFCRIKVGSYYVWADTPTSGSTWTAIAWLAAGTYDVLVEGWVGSSYSANITSMLACYIPFNDAQGSALAAYSSGIPITVPNRLTPVGSLNQAVYAVQVYATTSGALTRLENVGDNFTNGVSILVDGVQVNWTERFYPDVNNGDGVSGKVFLPYSVGLSHTVTISPRNGSTSIHVSITACPWILSPVNHTPVTFSFAQGSTFYCVENPLFADVTKFIGVGKQRSISFGTATDYYNSTSATGLIVYSFQLDVYDVTQVTMATNGWGGCIEIIGVDAR